MGRHEPRQAIGSLKPNAEGSIPSRPANPFTVGGYRALKKVIRHGHYTVKTLSNGTPTMVLKRDEHMVDMLNKIVEVWQRR